MSEPFAAAVEIVRGGRFVLPRLIGFERFRLPAMGSEEAETVDLLPQAWRRRLAGALRPLQRRLRRYGIHGLPPLPPPWTWIPDSARNEIRWEAIRTERRLAGLRQEMAASYPQLLREALRQAEAAAQARAARLNIHRKDRPFLVEAHLRMLWTFPDAERIREIPRLELAELSAGDLADLLDGEALAMRLVIEYRARLLEWILKARQAMRARGVLPPRLAASLRTCLDLLPPDLGRLDPILQRAIHLLSTLLSTIRARLPARAHFSCRDLSMPDLERWSTEVLAELVHARPPCFPDPEGEERCG
jgi:hypothetical protein